MPIQESISRFLKTCSITGSHKIVVAVSAGMDSMILLHALHQLGQAICVAHVNHGKRAESEEEELFLKNWCTQQNIDISIKKLNPAEMPAGANFQDWARQQRYAFFTEVAKAENCRHIATAHHFNDKVETFFGHALRGSGLNGLSSLRQVEGNIIRPLLEISHEVLKKYAQENKLEWREDASNATDDYQRNRIRHHILPELAGVNARWQLGVKTTFQNLEVERALLASLVATWAGMHTKKVKEQTFINLAALQAETGSRALLYHLLAETDSGFDWQALANSPNDAVGSFYFGTTHRALRDREWLIVESMPDRVFEPAMIQPETTHISTPIGVHFLRLERDAETNVKNGIATKTETFLPTDALLDYEKLHFPLTLRPWQLGDKFVPLGMHGTQLISDYLINAKISRSQKEKTFVLTSNDKIVWLVGHRISEAFKVGVETQKMYLARPLKVEELTRE